MTGETNWSYVLLKENPFDINPPTDPNRLIWAGMPKLKGRFNEIFEEGISSSVTQVVLNRGPLGGGKTHASLYFERQENLPKVKTGQVKNIHSFSIHAPKATGKPDEDFYIELLDKFGMTQVRQIVRSAIKKVNETSARKSLQNVLVSEEITQAFWLLGVEESVDLQQLLRAYFLEGCTRTELRKLGIARNITKSQDRIRVLAGVLQCLIGLDLSRALPQHSRVCLWIDEMEDLVYFTSAQFRLFTQGLRELIDRLPNFFTLFLNFTLTEPEEYEEIEVILGRAVIDRITDVIYFPELDLDEAVQYVKELINHPEYRIKQPESKGLPPIYPFEEDALRLLLDGLDKRTPRDINKRCRNAIHFAFRDNRFPQAGKGIIDVAYVKQIEESELDREIE